MQESETRTVQSIGNIVIAENRKFVAAGAALSFLSLVRGHVAQVDADKRGHLPLAGTGLLAAYFALSVAARCLAVVVFFVPLLGLFDVLRLAQMGLLAGSEETTYDVLRKGATLSVEAEWRRSFEVDNMMEFYTADSMMQLAYMIVPCVVVAVHVPVTCIIWKMCGTACTGYWRVAHSFVCPPLFNDWEDIYREQKVPL